MSLNHPSIAYRVRESDRLALLAEVATARRAADARRSSTDRVADTATIRRCLCLALLAIGRRLHGAEPVGQVGTAMAGSGPAS